MVQKKDLTSCLAACHSEAIYPRRPAHLIHHRQTIFSIKTQIENASTMEEMRSVCWVLALGSFSQTDQPTN